MGHQDDVEPDMCAPIITLSIGCPAIFLMGGPSKQQPPTPLLLTSGDVLVLSGPARACFHGARRGM
jgi:alkylated DNA repair protein alkB family protein 1